VPLLIIMQPAYTTVRRRVVQFTVKAAGTPSFGYRWRKDKIVIANTTGPIFAVASAVKADAGSSTVNLMNSSSTSAPPCRPANPGSSDS